MFRPSINSSCTSCGFCIKTCPTNAIKISFLKNGEKMKSFKYLLYLFFILNLSILNINAKDLTPTSSLLASGGVIDLVLNNDKLYASTAASSVDIFDIKTQEKIDSIKMPKIKDFLGDVIDSKIYSVDVLENNILILSQGEARWKKS
jgi:ferredoxin